MIEVFVDKRFGMRQRIAIERHVNDPTRNVLSRKQQLYHAGYREPNYTLPALYLYTAQIRPEAVIIWKDTATHIEENMAERLWVR